MCFLKHTPTRRACQLFLRAGHSQAEVILKQRAERLQLARGQLPLRRVADFLRLVRVHADEHAHTLLTFMRDYGKPFDENSPVSSPFTAEST